MLVSASYHAAVIVVGLNRKRHRRDAAGDGDCIAHAVGRGGSAGTCTQSDGCTSAVLDLGQGERAIASCRVVNQGVLAADAIDQ